MIDIATTTTGDIDLTGLVPQYVDGPEAVVVRLRERLSKWRAAWFLDLRAGFPYREILTKNPDLDRIASMFRAEISGCPGVVAIKRLTLTLTGRTLTLSFLAQTDEAVISVTAAAPMTAGEMLLTFEILGGMA